MQNKKLPLQGAFYSTFRGCNFLYDEIFEYVNLLKNGWTTEQALIKFKLSKPPPAGNEDYHHLQEIWKPEQIGSFKYLLHCYYKKDVFPASKSIQKANNFYQDKTIDVLKLDCTIPNPAIICPHKSTDANIWPFTEEDRKLLETFEECLLVVHLLLLHKMYLLMKLFFKSQQTSAKLLLVLMQTKFNLLDVSTHTDRSLLPLGSWFREKHFQSSRKQCP